MKFFVLALSLLSFSARAAETTVKVKGMVCSMCAQGIEKKFKGAGMEKVQVNLSDKLVHLEGKNLTDEEIKKIITEAGYNVDSITRK